MTKWFFLFLLALIIVLGARFLSYSPLPEDVLVDCVPIEGEIDKLSGLWELNRLDNFEALYEKSEMSQNEPFKTLANTLIPFVMERSQLYRIELCEYNAALSFNFFNEWYVITAELDKGELPKKQLKVKDEIKEAFNNALAETREVLDIEDKSKADKELKILQKPKNSIYSGELSVDGEELIIYGSFNNNSFKERIFFDTGELVRKISFSDSQLGSITFTYRKYP